MVTFIRLYPIFAICMILVSFDLARDLKRKGNVYWLAAIGMCVFFLISIFLWWNYNGWRNADQWAKEWASLIFSQYSSFV